MTLVNCLSKIFRVSPHVNFKFDWKATLPVVDFRLRHSFLLKISFIVIAQHWCQVTIFQNNLAKTFSTVLGMWNGQLIAVNYLLE